MAPPEDPTAPPPLEGWWVYVLWSDARARTYVGTTTDIARRLRQHNGELVGGARATRAGRPWRLAASYGPYPDRGTATRAELALKRRPGVRRLTWDGAVPASKGRTAPPQDSDPPVS